MFMKMPIGVDDFKEVRENYYFVDKSAFIADLTDNPGRVTLITRPRRFGKTLLLSMVDYFFSVEKASGNEMLFHNLAIARGTERALKQQGTLPVIFLTLKNIQSGTWENAYEAFKLCLQDEFQRHDYLLESASLSEIDKAFYLKILKMDANPAEYQQSLYRLSAYLSRHWRQKTVILIDEYDAPIQYAYEYGYYDEAISFFRPWYNSTLKGNPYLAFSVLTGVLRIAKESIFSGLNNLDVCSLLTEKYSDVCGFTKEDIEKMAEDLHFEGKLEELRRWYDGYRIGDTEIYNPWSVVNYIANHFEPAPYWMNTSQNHLLKELLRKASDGRVDNLYRLIRGESIKADIDEGVIYRNIGADDGDLYSVLLNTGYLTISGKPDRKDSRYALKIPNLEIGKVYHREILDNLTDTLRKPDFDRLIDDLLSGNAEGFEKRLAHILLSVASVYDTASESFYHGLMLGLTAISLTRDYELKSNRESGYGRFDLALFPKDSGQAGVLMEFKVAATEKDLDARAAEAIQQVERLRYEDEFAAQGIKRVWKYGIAFCGKRVKILKE